MRLAPLALALACLGSLASVGGCGGCHHESDTARGEAIFRERCALCHATTSDDGQGPGLGGVFGHHAASGKTFPYSNALKGSKLTLDRAGLDRFLADPTHVVPGTRMVVAVPDASERAALVGYLATLHAATDKPRHAHDDAARAVIADAPPGLREGARGFGDVHDDGPGVVRRFAVGDLPAPYATPAVRNAPKVVKRSAEQMPRVPPGFHVDLFAAGLDAPRLLRVAPNGDLFVAESNDGRVRVLRAKDGATTAERNEVFASDLERPFGIAFYPAGPDPHFVYVAEDNAVLRFPYRSGDLVASGKPEVVVAKLANGSGGHWTRDLAFSLDGERMFVSVGSGSNVAEDMRFDGDLEAWQAAHALGATWGNEEKRADVLVFDPEGRGGRVFATGIRNCVGLAVQPGSGEVWCSTNERDGLGDDLVPDYVTRVREGAFYGWPWFYLGDHEDPRHKDARPDLRGRVTVPDVLLQSHSASLQLAFYDGAMFPAAYRGQAFAALHGSWNRSKRTGYKVVRIALENGAPTGAYEDFMTGFVVDDDSVWGRPVGVAVARDGALFVSEDGSGTVWRVSATP